MKLKNITASVLTAAAMTLSAGAQADLVTVDGVSWDPDSLFDFTAQNVVYETTAALIGQEITGIGQITALNGSGSFCAGCQLTFEFGGYTLLDNNPTDYDPDGAGPIDGTQYGISAPTATSFGDFLFTGGWLKVYVDTTTAFNSLDKTTATDGQVWLSLLAVDSTGSNAGVTLAGSLTQLFSNGLAGQGHGLFDVIGGDAQLYIDTNGQTGGRDLSYTSSFQPIGGGQATPDGYNAFGTSEVHGDSIPEPASVALLGLGLLGMGLARRNRKSA